MGRVVEILSKVISKMEAEATLKLDQIIYSSKHGHEICIMHLVGKNIFPKMTTEEILSTPQSITGICREDLITIIRLDEKIKAQKNKLSVIESDRNGTFVIQDGFGQKKRYSGKLLSFDGTILDKLKGRDAFSMGYKIGFKEGCFTRLQKRYLYKKIKNLISFVLE